MTTKKYLARLLLCVFFFSTGFPAHSQTLDHPTLSETQQKTLDEKLMNTLSFGPRGDCDLKAVQGLLQQGASPNARNEDGNTLTALMFAAQNGCSDIVKLLLDAGAKVNAKASNVSAAGANVLFRELTTSNYSRKRAPNSTPRLFLSTDKRGINWRNGSA